MAHQDELPGFDPDHHIGRLLRLSDAALERRTFDRLSAGGFDDLGRPQVRIMCAAIAGPQRPSELAKRSLMTHQALNHVVTQLIHSGYMKRTKVAGGDSHVLVLTTKGTAAASLAALAHLEFEAEYRRSASASAFRGFVSVLELMATEGRAVTSGRR
jgi:DNA-binding MarR family transcriptional regulator